MYLSHATTSGSPPNRTASSNNRDAARPAAISFEGPPCHDGSARSNLCSTDAKRSEEHTSELQSRPHLVCRLLLEKKNSPIQVRMEAGRRVKLGSRGPELEVG